MCYIHTIYEQCNFTRQSLVDDILPPERIMYPYILDVFWMQCQHVCVCRVLCSDGMRLEFCGKWHARQLQLHTSPELYVTHQQNTYHQSFVNTCHSKSPIYTPEPHHPHQHCEHQVMPALHVFLCMHLYIFAVLCTETMCTFFDSQQAYSENRRCRMPRVRVCMSRRGGGPK